jgi:hypothetical protein
MNKALFIKKASGATVPFSEERLRNSLMRAGAASEDINAIINSINAELYEGISTKKIYRLAFNLLKKRSKPVAARYHLKNAIMELGPSGFPFEKYVAAIFKWEGYETQTGVISQGKCVSHEVDVIAEKGDDKLMMECKYHNQSGIFTEVKVPLYVKSRFDDLQSAWNALPGQKKYNYKGYIVTNTRFSFDALQYGNCAGLNLLGWDYPYKNGLKDRIDKLGLYPITCLNSLTRSEKKYLLEQKIILCHELNVDVQRLRSIGIRSERIPKVLEEVKKLCAQSPKDESS